MSDDSEERDASLKEYYVYELYDRLDKSVFYVGEGVRERAYDHEKESDRIFRRILADPSLEGKITSEKTRRIRQIIENSKESSESRLGVRIIGRFDTKAEARSVETVLINWIYGHQNLSNINRGHGAAWVKQKHYATEYIEGLDIPRRIKVFGSGVKGKEYLKKHISMHEQHDHISMAQVIAEHLREIFTSLKIDDPCYWEYGRYVGVFVELVPNTIRMIIQLTASGRNQHVYNLKPTEGPGGLQAFKEQIDSLNDPSITIKNDGGYAKLPRWRSQNGGGITVSNNDLEQIVSQVRYAYDFFNGVDQSK